MSTTAESLSRLVDEGLLGMRAAVPLLGVGHPSTVVRFILRGVRLPDGTRVKLEGLKTGNKFTTSRPACLRFLAAQNPDADASANLADASPAKSKRRESKASALVEKILAPRK